MNLKESSRKDIGTYGEDVACEYLRRKGFHIEGRNIARKTGELDVIARKGTTLHFVEVKSLLCEEFLERGSGKDIHSPAANLHAYKIEKVARTAEWYVMEKGWEGEWQVDGLLVWLRARDGAADVSYLPQIV